MNFSYATHWHASGQSLAATVNVNTGDVLDMNLAEQLVEIETLIREGYIGEARFTIRKMVEAQAAIADEKLPGIFHAHQILESINQKLLMSISLENIEDITDMMDEIRGLYGLPVLSVQSSGKTKTVRHLFPARNLYNWLRS